MLRLVTIPISHYCEKARWALDRAGLPYREERHIQVIHRVAVRRAGGGLTAPVLVTPEGPIGESREILHWVDARLPEPARLFPAGAGGQAVEALCARFDDRLGPSARRLMYAHMIGEKELARPYNDLGVPAWEDRVMRVAWGPITWMVSRVLGVSAQTPALDDAAVFGELDHAASLLADGRPYLCGERFGAADLTFAALAAAVVVPPQYGVRLPQPQQMPEAMAAVVERARAHPAGAHAMRMFERHRHERAGEPVAQGEGALGAAAS